MKAREFLPAPELLSTVTQPGLEVFQVTTDPELASNVFYNYHQSLDPDSRFVLFNRGKGGASSLWLMDLADDFSLTPVTEPSDTANGGHSGFSFSPDGRWIWFSRINEARLQLQRRPVVGGGADTVFELDLAQPEFGGRKILRTGWLSFSHDGKRLLCVVFIEGIGKYHSVGIITFDMERFALHTAFETGPRNWNNKSQYAPCPGPKGEYLISVCDCYSMAYEDSAGRWFCDTLPEGEAGGSDYLVDEAGATRYAYPVGRDRPRQNVSHWAWFGGSLSKVFHCDAFDTAPHWRGAIMLAEPLPADDVTRHLGRRMPGSRQIELTRRIKRPDVYHICAGWDGQHLLCDTIALGYGDENAPTRYLYGATVLQDSDGPYIEPKYLLNPYSSWSPYWCECLPCFTPDKKWILFNSDYPGVNGYKGGRHTPQFFAARGFVFP